MTSSQNAYVADTHSLLWWFTKPSKLGRGSEAAFSEVVSGTADLIVPVIVIAELIYIAGSSRIRVDLDELLSKLQQIPNVQIVPLSLARVLDMPSLTIVPEMHDRLIVAEAKAHGASLITRDGVITTVGVVQTVW